MIYVNQNTPIRTIYQNGQFVLFVIKGTPYSTIYFPGGGGAKGAITGFSQSAMASYNSNYYYTTSGHYVPNTTVINDQYFSATSPWAAINMEGRPWVFYESSYYGEPGYSTVQILVNFRLYSPFPASLNYGCGIVSNLDYNTGNNEYNIKSINITAGFNYISDTLYITTKDTRKYVVPLVFGAWNSNWEMSHMCVQLI